jgi:hypothetical protein
MKKFIFIFIICVNYSCDNVIQSTIRGSWSIDSIKVNDNEEITCLSINVLHFSKDICSTPRNFCDTFTMLDEQSTEVNYKIISKTKDEYYLKLDTISIFYNDSFRITFFKDTKEKLLKAKLKSENIEIIMRKGLYNFDRNIKNTDKLIELTN